MKIIKDNAVGLFRFLGLLFSLFILPSRTQRSEIAHEKSSITHVGEATDNNRCPHCKQDHNCDYCDDWHYCNCGYWWKAREGRIVKDSYEGHEQDKYESIVGPSVPLIPTETVFCPKCHVLVAQVRHTKHGTEIIQNSKVLVIAGSNVTIQDGKEIKGFPIRCPNGHIVRIE